MTTVPNAFTYTRRPMREHLRSWLASDSVRNFIWLYYMAFFAWGVYGSVFAYPINLIIDPMGQFVYNMWVWTPLAAAPVALGGLALRHGGSPATEIKGNLLRADFLGLWMQIGGHLCMFVVLIVFIVTSIIGMEARQPIISSFLLTPYAISVAFLAAQCFYKVQLGKARPAS